MILLLTVDVSSTTVHVTSFTSTTTQHFQTTTPAPVTLSITPVPSPTPTPLSVPMPPLPTPSVFVQGGTERVPVPEMQAGLGIIFLVAVSSVCGTLFLVGVCFACYVREFKISQREILIPRIKKFLFLFIFSGEVVDQLIVLFGVTFLKWSAPSWLLLVSNWKC